MKLAYTVSTPDTKGNYLAYRGELEETFSILKDIGYQGVEAFVRDPVSMNQHYFSRVLEKYGLTLVAVGTGPMVAEDKLTFTSGDDRVRNEAIKRTKEAIDFASQYRSQVNIGKLRGNVLQGDYQQSLKRRDQAFVEICDYAASKNVEITLEPQCRFAIDNLNSTQEALAWADRMQLPNLYLMLDVFHMIISIYESSGQRSLAKLS